MSRPLGTHTDICIRLRLKWTEFYRSLLKRNSPDLPNAAKAKDNVHAQELSLTTTFDDSILDQYWSCVGKSIINLLSPCSRPTS